LEQATHLKLVRNLRQLGQGLLLVDELFPVKITETLTIEADAEICPEDSLALQPEMTAASDGGTSRYLTQRLITQQ